MAKSMTDQGKRGMQNNTQGKKREENQILNDYMYLSIWLSTDFPTSFSISSADRIDCSQCVLGGFLHGPDSQGHFPKKPSLRGVRRVS